MISFFHEKYGTNLPLNLTLGELRCAESESEAKSLELLHPDLEIKENHSQKLDFFTRSPRFGRIWGGFGGMLGGMAGGFGTKKALKKIYYLLLCFIMFSCFYYCSLCFYYVLLFFVMFSYVLAVLDVTFGRIWAGRNSRSYTSRSCAQTTLVDAGSKHSKTQQKIIRNNKNIAKHNKTYQKKNRK